MLYPFDNHTVGKFEIYGESYELVEPRNFEEFMEAIRVKDAIQTAIGGLMHDETSSEWNMLLQKQEGYIKEYLVSIVEFDNSFLISNINYLAKKNNLRIGEVESILGLSAGYISRTAKENSAKRLSIDVVWRIAQLFEVDIRALLEADLQIPNSNTDLAAKFLAKVCQDTETGLIEWICNGGIVTELNESISDEGLVIYENDIAIYHSKFLSKDARFLLEDDIFACKNIALNCEVLIIPFKLERAKDTHYEFLFRNSIDDENDPKFGTYYFTRMFTTADDPFHSLNVFADNLYRQIKDKEYDTRLSAGAKSIISKYLKIGEQ